MEPQAAEYIGLNRQAASAQKQENASPEAFFLRDALSGAPAAALAKIGRITLFVACLGVPALAGYALAPAYGSLPGHKSAAVAAFVSAELFADIWAGLLLLTGLALYRMLLFSTSWVRKLPATALYAAQLFMWCLIPRQIDAGWMPGLCLVLLNILAALCGVSFQRICAGAAVFLLPNMGWLLLYTGMAMGLAF